MVSNINHYALLIGICFTSKDRRHEWIPLKGCTRDVEAVKVELLKSFPKANIRKMTASLKDPNDEYPSEDCKDWPSHDNIISHLDEITLTATSGSYVYIHFTGHGTAIEPSSLELQFTRDTTGELALVVLSKNGCHMQYLRTSELAHCLGKMVEKGLRVTLVLDCCASGSTARDKLDPSIKFLPYDVAVDMAFPSRLDQNQVTLTLTNTVADNNSRPSYRNGSASLNWLISPDGLVVLAACGPDEIAKELSDNKGGHYGALSFFLVRTFARRGRFGGKQQHIFAQLCARFREVRLQQRPMLFGNKKLAFFDDSEPAWKGTAPISVLKFGTDLQLEAGLAQGISSGDVFQLHSNNFLGSGEIADPQPILVKVKDVRPLTSDLEFVAKPATPIKSGLVATEETRLSLRQFPVQLNFSNPLSESWTAPLQNRPSLQVSTTPIGFTDSANPPFLRLNTLPDNQYEMLDKSGTPLHNLPAPLYPLEEDPNFTLSIIEHLARYNLVKQLTNTPGNNTFRNSFQVHLLDSTNSNKIHPGCTHESEPNHNRLFQTDCPHPSCTTHIHHKDKVKLIIKNTGPLPLHIHVLFLCNALWEVGNLLSANHEVVPPRGQNKSRDFTKGTTGELRRKISMAVPECAQANGVLHCDDVIKVFITSQPTSFASLEQPELGEFLKSRAVPKPPDEGGSSMRGGMGEDWAVLTFRLRTRVRDGVEGGSSVD